MYICLCLQIQEHVSYATRVPVIDPVALVAERVLESVLVVPLEGRDPLPVWRLRPMPSLLSLRLRTLPPLSASLSGWLG